MPVSLPTTTMANELRSPVVLDATVLSNLAVTDDLDFFDALPARFVTVAAVTDELRAGVEAGYDHLERAIDATDEIAVEEKPGKDILENLDRGETYALSAAQQRTGTLATDDLPARELATERDIELTGSVGILIRLVVHTELSVDEADAILAQWITDAQYRSPVESVSEVLERDE
jgi:predicted nucleic acid-binding protein